MAWMPIVSVVHAEASRPTTDQSHRARSDAFVWHQARHHASQERTHRDNHHEREADGQSAGQGRVRWRGSSHQGDDGRQQEPRSYVVNRSARESQGAQRAPGEAALGQDPRQDRECRDGHGCPEEQSEGRECHSIAEGGVERERDPDAEGERHHHAHVRQHSGLVTLPPYEGRVQLEPDEEHEQHQPELREGIQRRQRIRGDQPGGHARRQSAEHGRPQQEAADDLTDDTRLSDAQGQRTRDSGHRDDDQRGEQHLGQQVTMACAAHRGGPAVARADIARSQIEGETDEQHPNSNDRQLDRREPNDSPPPPRLGVDRGAVGCGGGWRQGLVAAHAAARVVRVCLWVVYQWMRLRLRLSARSGRTVVPCSSRVGSEDGMGWSRSR